ncbi:hypothetical protein BaRGS_00010915 [Batillaria attramentaria]|uniref:Uncharacterized protein n=1 Tax=Batillaria attramentaria TaxID=370345 RepID=A0ABD0LEL4_9CAEN
MLEAFCRCLLRFFPRVGKRETEQASTEPIPCESPTKDAHMMHTHWLRCRRGPGVCEEKEHQRSEGLADVREEALKPPPDWRRQAWAGRRQIRINRQ